MNVFPGNYEDYVWRKEGGGSAQPVSNGPVELEPKAPAQQSAAPPQAAKTVPAKPAADRRLNPIKLRQMKERRREIEEEVTKLEAEIADYERDLADFKSAEESMRVSELLGARRADLESLLAEWEQVAQTIEANR